MSQKVRVSWRVRECVGQYAKVVKCVTDTEFDLATKKSRADS